MMKPRAGTAGELLGRFDIFDIAGEARDGNEALQMIIHKPAVAFLTSICRVFQFFRLFHHYRIPSIVFQTAYSEYAADAFDINALMIF